MVRPLFVLLLFGLLLQGSCMGMEKTSLVGTAFNSKGGAVIDSNQGIIYIQGLSYWPDEVVGKKVEVTGNLSEEKYLPDERDEKGLPQQGASGEQLVFRNASWKLITSE